MLHFIRNHSTSIIALGTGVALGVSVTLIYQKVSTDLDGTLRRLAVEITSLRREVETLKTLLETNSGKKKRWSGFYSIHASSGEEEDEEFLEAFEEAEFENKAKNEIGSSALPPVSNGEAITESGDLFEDVDKLMDGNDENVRRAYTLLKDKDSELGSDSEFMWRFSKATYMLATVGAEPEKKEHVYQSNEIAKKAIELDENNSSAHKWFAVTIAVVGEYEGVQSKLQNGLKYREHIEKAIKLNPHDSSLYYLLGRWQFGVYTLSWLERQAAARIFGTSISADIDDALHNFLEANRIKPGNWKENLLYIAKCHIEKRDYYSAVSWLDKANEIATISQSDKDAQKEVDNYLYKYGSYRR